MDKKSALSMIDKMHETRTVTNESIIAWYYFYEGKLPKMNPERSEVDLVRTVALWMKLTDMGGVPEFPYDYRSAVVMPSVDPVREPKPRVAASVAILGLLGGLILLFLDWRLGIIGIGVCLLILVVGYRRAGGPTNPDLMTEGTSLYEREGRRVFQWHQEHRQEGE